MESAWQENKRAVMVCCLLLALISFLQYAYSFGNDFVWDSAAVFSNDPSIRDVRYLPGFFTEDFYRHVPLKSEQFFYLKYYRPLTKVLHLLEYSVFGSNPLGYHSIGIALNAAAVVLAFLFVNAVTGNMIPAFFVALLYAVNPTRVEAVSWAYSDSYLVVAVLALFCLSLYHGRRLAAAYAVFSIAVFFHEMAILLPLIVILYECFLSHENNRTRWLRTVPFFVIAAAFLALRRAIIGQMPMTRVDPLTWFNTSAVVVKRYVKIFFVPDALVTIYPHELFPAVNNEVLVSYLCIAVLFAIGLILWFRRREYLFWYLWFFVWISVSFNVGQFGDFLMADKLLNLASLGLCALIGLLPFSLLPQRRTAVQVALIALIVFHSGTTFARTLYWRNNIVYFEKALEHTPNFITAINELGTAYYKRGEWDKAIAVYERATKINPQFGMAYENLGMLYTKKGHLDDAEKALDQALRLDPGNVLAHYDMGVLLEKRGRLKEAVLSYRRYLDLDPNPPVAVVAKIRMLEKKEMK